MKRFESKDIAAAMDFAEAGGVALHVWKGAWPGKKPRCFRDGQDWGHLFDMNPKRLVATARRLGVRVIKVSRIGGRGQHIDLCGKPLAKAIQEARDG